MSGSDSIRIITNDVPRDIIYGFELSAEERAQFDYIDWAKIDSGEGDIGEFVRYRGKLYHLGDMMPSSVPGWGMMVQETFFSGVLFRYAEQIDSEHVVCGRYYA